MHFQETEARLLVQELAPLSALQLACAAPISWALRVPRSHGTRDVAFGWTHGGHGSARSGWERRRDMELEAHVEPVSCYVSPCSGYKASG